jgi:hypothetical protein
MQRILLFSVITAFLYGACTDAGVPVKTDPVTVQAAENKPGADSAAIAESLHGFFHWYNGAAERLNSELDFVDVSGPHPRLDESKLQRFLSEFKKSGFVSEAFLQHETNFYRTAAKLWADEDSDGVPSGMDADKFYCAQDMEPAEFTTAPVKVRVQGNTATADLLLDPNGPNGSEKSFEMVKENGKWLLAKVNCDMGI